MFLRLLKVDEAKREVWGTIAEELADKSGEIMDYESSKPYFQKWSAEFEKATDGESLGNVREMHTRSAVGRLTLIEFDDKAKRIDVCAKIVDEAAWQKVLEKVYTGFSIGGGYIKRWADAANAALKRYTANPAEVSLVDNPCLGTAHYSMVKVDGTVEEIALKIAERTDTSPSSGSNFADAKNKKYPLDTAAHVRAAASYFGMPKNRKEYSAADQATIDKKIQQAKIKFGIGDAKKFLGAAIDKLHALGLHKVAEPLEAEAGRWALKGLRKGMYGVACLANVLAMLDDSAKMAEIEAQCEGDLSEIPDRLKEVRAMLGEVLVDMTEEEVSELNPEGEGPMENSEKIAKALALIAEVHGAAALGKAVTGKEHQAMVQEIHDHAAALGAGHNNVHDEQLKKDGYSLPAGAGKKEAGEDDPKDEDAEKMAKSLESALKRIEALEAQPAVASATRSAVVTAIGKDGDDPAAREAALKKAADDEKFNKATPEQQAFLLIKKATAEAKPLSTQDLMEFGFAKVGR